MTLLRKASKYALLAAAITLAAGAGFLSSTALGIGTQTPTRTVTIDVATGPTGPAGPEGPPGEAECPAGFSNGILVINAPGGQVSMFTCLAE